MKIYVRLILMISVPLFAGLAHASNNTITIGTVQTLDTSFYIHTFGPTLLNLRSKHPDLIFKTREFKDYDSMVLAAENNELDFFMTSAGMAAYLERIEKARAIATRTHPRATIPRESVGAAFISRSDRNDIRTLADLKGKKIAAYSDEGFDWYLALNELVRLYSDIKEIEKHTVFTNHEFPDVIARVANGDVDIGILSACEVEDLLKNESFSSKDFKVIGPRKSASLKCLHSTDLYPGIVVGAFAHTDPNKAKLLASSLLSMPPSRDAYSWGIANNYQDIESLFRKLKIKPFYNPTLESVWDEYKNFVYAAIVLIILFIIHYLRTEQLVRIRTEQLRTEIQKKVQLQKEASAVRDKLNRAERSGIISQLSSIVAHEVNQPLEAIINYSACLSKYVENNYREDKTASEISNRVAGSAARVAAIIDHVRSYAKKKESEKIVLSLTQTLKTTINEFQHADYGTDIKFEPDLGNKEILVEAEPLELKLLFSNLFRNAKEAMESEEEKVISVMLRQTPDGKAEIRISDRGRGLQESDLPKLTSPLFTRKPQGTGLGLSICRQIAESHGGHLEFEKTAENGLIVKVFLPTVKGNINA
ncbi:ATP-binding protein [uncultured Parasutterella sp.]|uniref:histidine kinase n=4 Tax=Parasutterella TaxID=577310 RepID=A0A6L6YIX8_9BURK|nr:ATP-binding protein [uncultured Parasutterella sp.]MVX56648.1 PhnD/SsuA/transferrin family substrate-binding protein [Parasutterella muris]